MVPHLGFEIFSDDVIIVKFKLFRQFELQHKQTWRRHLTIYHPDCEMNAMFDREQRRQNRLMMSLPGSSKSSSCWSLFGNALDYSPQILRI